MGVVCQQGHGVCQWEEGMGEGEIHEADE